VLLVWYLEIGEEAELEKLLDRYPDDAAAAWAYGRALHVFRGEGDTSRARKLRTAALAANAQVSPYLLGRKRLPRTLPDMIGFGDDSEAVVCASEQMAAWRQTPGALAWLDQRPESDDGGGVRRGLKLVEPKGAKPAKRRGQQSSNRG